jgi:hypothetical protein
MHLLELERAGCGAIQEASVAHGELPGRGALPTGRQRRARHAEALVPRQVHVCADVRRERAHAPLEQVGALLRVEPAVLGADLVRVGDARVGLIAEGGLQVERLHEQLPAQGGESGRQAAVGVVGTDYLGALRTHRSGVELRRGAHDRYAGLLVPRLDGTLHRSGPAPAGEQRRVHVQHLVLREQRVLDERAVGADRDGLRPNRRDALSSLLAVHVLGLEDLDAEQLRRVRHRRGGDLAAAAATGVGPGDHELRPVRARGEPVEHRGREVGCPQVDRAHQATSTTWSTRGPCTPSTRSNSMSDVADGPETNVSGRPVRTASSRFLTASGTSPTT